MKTSVSLCVRACVHACGGVDAVYCISEWWSAQVTNAKSEFYHCCNVILSVCVKNSSSRDLSLMVE